MSAQPAAVRRRVVKGVSNPRIAPPLPIRSASAPCEAAAKELGIVLMPWQKVALRYINATRESKGRGKTTAPSTQWLYRESCNVVARQNGKTTLLLPLIYSRLMAGRKILHTAQNRIVPRETFLQLAVALNGHPDVVDIRFANGQESIRMASGAKYTLVAPRPGVRGHAVDDVILDEVREYQSFDLIAAIKPTMTASANPQLIYLSNAGDDESLVLNDLRRRADTDPRLAYLEWSADPERDLDDEEGWREANPALGITIDIDTLRDERRSLPAAVFETEHLCRWVTTMQPRVVAIDAWDACHGPLAPPTRPVMAVSMDGSGTRASAVVAWAQEDGTVGMRVAADVTGEPIDMERLGPELRDLARKLRVTEVLFDPWTDADLARYFRHARPVNGVAYANASERFARLVDSGRLRWDDAAIVGEQLAWTGRKDQGRGAWMAVRSKPERPVTAVLAAIRACWVASEPRQAAPRIY